MELLVVIVIIGLFSIMALYNARANNYAQRCKDGDLESCRILKEKFPDFEDKNGIKAEDIKPIKKDNNSCERQKITCRYDCAEDKLNNLDDCLLRCDIKNEECLFD